jgi:dTDP-4-dehydrorhamnose reductase
VTDISSTLSFLVLGSDGQVGLALCQYLAERRVPYQGISSQDCAKVDQLVQQMAHSDHRYVFNLLFEESTDRDLAAIDHWTVLAETIASACAEHKRGLFQLSSARVFSGKLVRGYLESDVPAPISPLGQQYWAIEQRTLELCPESVLVRPGWLFSEYGPNFLTQLVDAAIEQQTLKITGKLRGNPTDAHALAKVLLAMAEQIDCNTDAPPLWGTYHYVDSDACSLFTFAKTVITVVKSMTDVRVETVEEGETQTMVDTIAEMENYQLGCKKILSTFGIKQRPWRRGLHDVLKVVYSSS